MYKKLKKTQKNMLNQSKSSKNVEIMQKNIKNV